MGENYDLLLKGATVVNQDGTGARDVGVRAGRIAAIGTNVPEKAAEVIDAKGLHILPGVIDTQVHFREPGLEHKEDLETGSRAAVKGGVTAVFEMPNTKPPTTSAAALADKVARARNRMLCDFAFYVGATRDNIDELASLERLEGAAGIKVFAGSSTGDLLVDDEAFAPSHPLAASAGAPPSIRRTRRGSRSAWASGGKAIRPRIPNGATPKPRSSPRSAWCASPRR